MEEVREVVTLLLVTWFLGHGAASSYTTVFRNEQACERARAALILEADRLNAEVSREQTGDRASRVRVSAVCVGLAEREPAPR